MEVTTKEQRNKPMTELLDTETDLPISAGEDDMRQFLREKLQKSKGIKP